MANTTHDTWLLTTKDNPYNPFTEWREWLFEDMRLGYNTPGLIARIAAASDTIADDVDSQAMRDIVELNPTGQHLMVSMSSFEQDRVPP
jgi:hypothetical protein